MSSPAPTRGGVRVTGVDGDQFDATRRPVRSRPRRRAAATSPDLRRRPAPVRRRRTRSAARSGRRSGYPGGGSLTVVPAAVTGAYAATGRDIYGEARVRRRHPRAPRARSIAATAADRSCFADGTIGGLVFAEARTDPDVGYALSPTRVATRIAPALGRHGDRRHRGLRALSAAATARRSLPSGSSRRAIRWADRLEDARPGSSGTPSSSVWNSRWPRTMQPARRSCRSRSPSAATWPSSASSPK